MKTQDNQKIPFLSTYNVNLFYFFPETEYRGDYSVFMIIYSVMDELCLYNTILV